MKPSEALQSHRAAIRSVVEAHRAHNARVFGSVLHGQDTDESDLNILIDPTPETTLFDTVDIDEAESVSSQIIQDAVIRNLEVISDASRWGSAWATG